MPSAARAWHTTISAYSQGCALVRFERSMWCVTILIGAHIDDFILACADRATLDTFRQGFRLVSMGDTRAMYIHASGVKLTEISMPAVLFYRSVILLKTFCVP